MGGNQIGELRAESVGVGRVLSPLRGERIGQSGGGLLGVADEKLLSLLGRGFGSTEIGLKVR